MNSTSKVSRKVSHNLIITRSTFKFSNCKIFASMCGLHFSNSSNTSIFNLDQFIINFLLPIFINNNPKIRLFLICLLLCYIFHVVYCSANEKRNQIGPAGLSTSLNGLHSDKQPSFELNEIYSTIITEDKKKVDANRNINGDINGNINGDTNGNINDDVNRNINGDVRVFQNNNNYVFKNNAFKEDHHS